MANFEAMKAVTSPLDSDEELPCISAKQRRKLENEKAIRKTLELDGTPKSTTTESAWGFTEGDVARDGVLLRPISWDLSSTRPTTP